MFNHVQLVALAATLALAAPAAGRTFVIPHLSETSATTTTPNQLDNSIFLTYTPGLVDGEPVSTATAQLYLLDNNGQPMKSSTMADVCYPCVYNLSAMQRRHSISVNTLIAAAGGFPASVVIGMALIQVSGDDEHVAVASTLANSHTGPFDLSILVHDVAELPAGTSPSFRLISFPWFSETSLSISSMNAFDTYFYAAYAGGVAGSAIPAGGGATVSLYLLNDAGVPLRSATNADVCAPCNALINSTTPKTTFSVQSLYASAGGFPASIVVGQALVVISGSADAVAIRPLHVNSHTSAFDLSLAGLEGMEMPTSRAPTAAGETPSLPPILSSSPNPFQAARIDYSVVRAGEAGVEVVDARGRVVAHLARGLHAAGSHFVHWDGRDDAGASLPSGVYFAQLVTPDGVRTLKLTLIH